MWVCVLLGGPFQVGETKGTGVPWLWRMLLGCLIHFDRCAAHSIGQFPHGSLSTCQCSLSVSPTLKRKNQVL